MGSEQEEHGNRALHEVAKADNPALDRQHGKTATQRAEHTKVNPCC